MTVAFHHALLTCDPRKGLGPDQYANLNCFTPPGVGQAGVYVFPYLKGPTYNAHDLTMAKTFAVTESKKLCVNILQQFTNNYDRLKQAVDRATGAASTQFTEQSDTIRTRIAGRHSS
jgi:hypothetical protein